MFAVMLKTHNHWTMEIGDSSKRVLLTGAGFSRNWDGLLASEFFNRLISHENINSSDNLRALLLQETNFEAALHKAKTQGLSASEVRLFEQAILDVYIDHDQAIRRTGFHGETDINIYGVQGFISRFYGGGDTGYIFTLNQDLLLERKYYNYTIGSRNAPRPTLPGIPPHRDWFQTHMTDSYSGLPPDYTRTVLSASVVPDSDWPPKLKGQFNYIKLHGSFDWRDPSGNNLLVIGGGKVSAIASSPILKWYSDVFRAVCSAGDVRLFISGYGFADEHINETIAAGVKGAKLRIFIHNTIPSASMQTSLASMPYGKDIWPGLIGYSNRPLIEIFPGNQRRTQEIENIERVFF